MIGSESHRVTPRKIRLVLLIAAAIVLLSSALLWSLRSLTADHTSNRQQLHETAQAARQPTASATPAAKTPQLTLPGAVAITPITGNYNDPSSLWVVVSKDHPLSDVHYIPAHLQIPPVTTRTDKTADEQSLRSDIATPVSELFAGARSAGYELMLASGYRSYELQTTYFSNYARLNGEEKANTFSARPGQSEHQTGLAFDVSLPDRSCYLEICFGETPAGKWLAEHSWEYGFILRYPADKTAITKYQYEPWHFRYVGRDLAKALHQSGLTLDQAYPYLQAVQSAATNTTSN